jgi:hypothetical protein
MVAATWQTGRLDREGLLTQKAVVEHTHAAAAVSKKAVSRIVGVNRGGS